MKKRLVFFIMIVFLLGCTDNDNNEIIVSGTVEVKDIRISSELPGKVLNIYKREGEEVQEGEVLLKIEDLQYKIQMKAAEIQKEQVIALLNDSESDYKRAKNLFQANSISKEQYNKAELNFKINTLRLQEVEENISLLDLYLTKTEIFSPVTGVIYERYVEQGEVISPGFPLFFIHDLKDLYIKTYIQERYIGMVSIGDNVFLNIDAYPGKRFKGIVNYISSVPEFTPSTLQTEDQRVIQVYEVRVLPLEGWEHFKPGLFTTVIFQKKKL
ncbi:MAG TPA: efflux RND transporter periplasmic adaptor subunit [Firmicutes bacterium]|nr:efflux RND transporter periplasmic adaptor subunit [Bacillota bacterium]